MSDATAVSAVSAWHDVCAIADLETDRGVCALVDGHQVAIFRVSACRETLAVSNRDPFSGANVISRGIVGTQGGVPIVASPVYKHRFDLRSGMSLDDADVSLAVYPVRIVGDRVEVALR
jgi:nitrite reductase (NADH) small subunit